MATLTSALSIATQALLNNNAGIDVTSNNIANANTQGYSRQVPILEENAPIQLGKLELGDGASINQIESIRDRVLELRIQQETSQQSDSNAYLGSIQQVQTLFGNTQGGGLENALNGFFSSLTQLSSNPSDSATRQSVLAAGQNLANQFNQLSAQLNLSRSQLNQSVTDAVTQVNQLTQEIAAINPQIAALQATGQNTGTLEDQRNQLINQLSQVIDISVIPSDNGFTLTTGNGAALVVGNQSFALSLKQNAASGGLDVYANGKDITSNIQSGQLHGLIQARDVSIPSYLNQLDTFAAGLSNAVNTVQTQGFDLNGNKGTNFFSVPPASGAAGAMQVAITDASLIAASSDGSSGSNGNANALAAIQNQAIVNGSTATQLTSNLVAQIGNDVAQANSRQSAQSMTLQQLQGQRSAISGVSIDEEAANLVKYQNAFQAAARVISTIDLLTQTVINIGAASTSG